MGTVANGSSNGLRGPAGARRGVDLLLVRPPDLRPGRRLVVPPVGLLYVAAAAERAGHRVAVVDAEAENLTWPALVARVKAARPEVLGLGGMTPLMEPVRAAARLLRPHVPRLVLGGVHATRFRERALEEVPEADALVIGEGEGPIADLLPYLAAGGRGDPPPGVMTRGAPFREAASPRDLDALPPPALHLVPNPLYGYLFQTRPGVTTLITSRGCPFRCTFCDKTVSGSRYRWHAPERVVGEVLEAERRHGLGYAVLFDDNFTLRRERVAAICEGLARAGTRLEWKCEARVDGVDPELLRLMRRAGCRTVAFGVESGHQKSLDRLRKAQSVARTREVFRQVREAGLESVAYVLLGIPGETPAESLASMDWCREIGADFVQFSTLSPFPGTPMYEEAVREGWLRTTRVRNPADAEEWRETLVPPGWTEEDLRRVVRSAYARFYFRPSYLARQAARAARGGALPVRARLGLRVARWWAAGLTA